jgi:hypothetical protein
MLTKPKFLLHIEGVLVFLAAILAYRYVHASWPLFFVLLLVPDLFMLGSLINARIGAVVYNSIHTYTGPLLAFGFSSSANKPFLIPFILIWAAHIGMDRMLGFGLKYPT